MLALRLKSPVTGCLLILAGTSFLHAQFNISITVAPPPIPVYEQPDIPEDGYVWAPGYWAWGDEGYFWVPGTWVTVPETGMLWTPGYWGWGGDSFVFHTGYWGPHVGFYGGVNYGHGYGGSGFDGGYWQGEHFYYNRAVTAVDNARLTYVYEKPVIASSIHVAYNGGSGGTTVAPTAQDQAAAGERHVAPTAQQVSQHQSASQNKALLVSANHGAPSVAATRKPGDFTPRNVVPAKAPGGPVGEDVLKATPKNPAQPLKGPAPTVKPSSPAPQPAPVVQPRPAPNRVLPAPEKTAPPPPEPRPAQTHPAPKPAKPEESGPKPAPRPAAPQPAPAPRRKPDEPKEKEEHPRP